MPTFEALKATNMVRLRQIQLRIPSLNRSDSLFTVIKAFQNPIGAEQARERLKLIKTYTELSISRE